MTGTDPKTPRARRGLVAPIAGAVVVAAVIAVVFVLPAEYGVDPTGIGGALGLTQVSEPQEIVVETAFAAPPEIAQLRDTPFRTDTVTIEVPPFTENFGQLEYKISMNAGDVMVYSWTSDQPLLYEFHGHTLEDGSGDPVTVMDYIADEGQSAAGTLTAPIDGIHGWYFANSTFDAPAIVTLELAGYYDLEPGVLALGR